MSAIKDAVHRMLDRLPEDVTWEDLQYHLYVCEKIDRGLADVAAGRVFTIEEARAQLRERLGARLGA